MGEEETQLYNRRASDIAAAEARLRGPLEGQKGLRIRLLNAGAIIIAAILSLTALVAIEHILESEHHSEEVHAAYDACSSAARDLQDASDYLTSCVRVFVVSGNRAYMDAYLEELEVTDRRGKAVETLGNYFGKSDKAVIDLENALSYSNELADRELYAMKLTCDAIGLEDVPKLVSEVTLSEEDASRPVEEQRDLAEHIVLGEDYQSTKDQIIDSVNACSDVLLAKIESDVAASEADLHARLTGMQVIVMGLLLIVLLVIFAVIFLILWPLAAYAHRIVHGQSLHPAGASELRYLALAYNLIYEENRERTIRLKHAAERDALTGLYNRGAYDVLLAECTEDVALLLIDVDYFKSVNDGYGHDIGDAILKKVARLISSSFRNSDYPCRIGGDEFAVIMTDMHADLRQVVVEKLMNVAHALADTSDGLPRVTLSIGIAFSERNTSHEDLYRAADSALYVVKERGRNGFAFYGEA